MQYSHYWSCWAFPQQMLVQTADSLTCLNRYMNLHHHVHRLTETTVTPIPCDLQSAVGRFINNRQFATGYNICLLPDFNKERVHLMGNQHLSFSIRLRLLSASLVAIKLLAVMLKPSLTTNDRWGDKSGDKHDACYTLYKNGQSACLCMATYIWP